MNHAKYDINDIKIIVVCTVFTNVMILVGDQVILVVYLRCHVPSLPSLLVHEYSVGFPAGGM